MAPQKIKSIYWRKCFPDGYKEIDYTGSNYCSLYLIIDLVDEFKNKKLTVEGVKEDLLDEYKKITENFTNRDIIDKIINILREEAQFDANQLQDGTMNFEQMIIQEGFVAVNFDLWLLLVRYEIPSIFISSKLIPETRYNSHEFVCYSNNGNEYAFIVTPAMYRRTGNKLPEYKIIVSNKENIKVQLGNFSDSECLTNIHTAIDNYVSIEDYIDLVFERDITTKYKPKRKGLREIEYEVVSGPVEVIDEEEQDIVPKKMVKRLKGKKIAPTLVLEEAEEAIENLEENVAENALEELVFPEEQIDITPVKSRKTRKQREQKLKVNPHGKKGSRRKLPENIEIEGDVEVVD